MVLQVKFRIKLYRRFEKDIWGLARTKLQARNKYLLYLYKIFLFKAARRRQAQGNFIYDEVFIFKRQGKKKMKKRFLSLRLVKLFYLTMSYRQFRRLSRLAGREEGFFQSNFCHRLEGRACVVLYRSNLVANMFMAIHLVKYSSIWVNKKLISSSNYLVKIGDIVTLFYNFCSLLRFHLFLRLLRKSVYFSMPRHMFISYKIFLITMVEYPKDQDLAFPTKMDIYRLSGYY